jgi:hypothetical protein
MDTRPDTQCGHRACIAPTACPVTFGVNPPTLITPDVKATIRLPLSLRGSLVVDPVFSCPHRTRAVPKLGDFGTLKTRLGPAGYRLAAQVG